ncbi:MAG: DISARM system helicase DrmA [Candidatus Obscuribacterales bacterium]|nr:DISARM system helicase DrmA [Candidatus Obscuribacterales bacterium]
MKSTTPVAISPVEVREQLVNALQLDLIGPGEHGSPADWPLGDAKEVLEQRPSTWYLTGFLVPNDATAAQKGDDQSVDELDEVTDAPGADDASTPEAAPAQVRYLPSSMGLSVLVSSTTQQLMVTTRWGDYKRKEQSAEDSSSFSVWERQPKEEQVLIEISRALEGHPKSYSVPNSNGLSLVVSGKEITTTSLNDFLPSGTKSISIFLVNNRQPSPDDVKDEAFAFQAQLEIESGTISPFVPRPDFHSLESDDWDDRVADLQYRDVFEFGVGHGISIDAVHTNGSCSLIRTRWIPLAEVERVAPTAIDGVFLEMEQLAAMSGNDDVDSYLGAFEKNYRTWIETQRRQISTAWSKRKQDTANELLRRAEVAAMRIGNGVKLLCSDAVSLEAFRIANRAMALAARRRMGAMNGKDPSSVSAPKWRPFQLAFILMNLVGIAKPVDEEREVVDLLFFPTGGGKTEAYLGLAAFTLVLRRLKNPGINSAGLSVLMRYTLRLLTLDQLSRASTLICALELERAKDVEKLGTWPFEIGLWVGKAATPNVIGEKGESTPDSARARLRAYLSDDSKPSPIPLEACPWCGTKFRSSSFNLYPNPDYPTELRINCANRNNCDFARRNLPIAAVDEQLYRRLPCFMVATVDKFAALPWTGEVGKFFGRAQRYDDSGFYGPCEPLDGKPLPNGMLLPPDLIIQDELHLISGPLGTIVGLYETALDELCNHRVEDKTVRAKIIASTATVRRAENQIRALFNRRMVDIFPPPGPNRRDSFFAETHSTTQSHAREYVGIAAQGRSPKVVMMRIYLALLAAGQKLYSSQKKNESGNSADSYMTLLGYFNSLRELGGARRLIEDEVSTRLSGYGSRKRVNETEGLFRDRKIHYEVVELTSRISTNKVAEAKRRLELPFSEKEHVDVAIATNMISVGLDIPRLGLMVAFGQPKTSSEYIQATSRVGRNHENPGLVITILNIHKPRDRSHYERFTTYHKTFYRSVEATSVTPFSPRALDRGLAGTVIGLARQCNTAMTPPTGASQILSERSRLNSVIDALVARAESHADMSSNDQARLRARVKDRAADLFDVWSDIANETRNIGGSIQYQVEQGNARRLLYEFLNPELETESPRFRKFRSNRSMRDVEPSVNLWIKTMDDKDVEEQE